MGGSEVFLRDKGGAPIGPLPLDTLEVLYATRVIGESTPISLDGDSFVPLAEQASILAHVRSVKDRVVGGEFVWDLPGEAAKSKTMSLPPPAGARSPIKALVQAAIAKAEGRLVFTNAEGEISLSYLDGKVVEIHSELPRLSLSTFLSQHGIDGAALRKAEAKAPELGGDLGAALISMGLIPPHEYMAKLVEWAKWVIADLINWPEGDLPFYADKIKAPAVPLGLERLRMPIEVARQALGKEHLERVIGPNKHLPLIPSQIEGATIDELQFDPKELRLIRSIDGTKNIGAVLEGAGKGAQALSAQRALVYALEIGLVVMGRDSQLPEEEKEARRLRDLLKKFHSKNYFEILGIQVDTPDEVVRDKHRDLAKQFHPDGVRTNAAPELLKTRSQLFTLIQETYTAVDTESKRYAYKLKIDQGFDSKADEQMVVRAMLEAETNFRKAEALIKLRKYSEALTLMDEALKRKPKDLELQLHRAYYAYLAAGQGADPKPVIAELERIVAQQDNLIAGWLFLGRLHKKAEHEKKMVTCFNQVLEYEPKNSEASSELRLITSRHEKEKKKKKSFF